MRNTKYWPLTSYLQHCGKEEVTLTFGQIEQILGFELPASTKEYRANWANTTTVRFPFSWLDAGYMTHDVDMDKGIVHFSKGSSVFVGESRHDLRERKRMTKQNNQIEVDSVIIERMYAGGYLDENIGHEVINTFKTDSNRHFIYISPWGVVNAKYAHSKNVLLVRGISAGVWEVIGYATQLELLLSDKSLSVNNQRITGEIDCQRQLDLIRDRDISYGGVPINELLREQTNVVFVTYEAHEYHSVKTGKQLYLVENEKDIKGSNYILLPNVKFGRQSLHMYMDEVSRKEAYDTLLELFQDKQWWDDDLCHRIDNLDAYDESFNILDVIKRDEDELTFSNWLAYYLASDSSFLREFCEKVLNINIDCSSAIVKREYENIDIWLEDEDNVIVIENKIKSGINGVVEERHNFASEGIKSQLSKYVSIAEEQAKGRKTTFRLLIPDYGVRDDELSVYKEYDRYLPVIRYSSLLSFLDGFNSDLPYYEDFKRAVKKHASPYKKNLYQVMEERLIAKIKTKLK